MSLMEQVFLPSEAQQHFEDAPQGFSVKTLPLGHLPPCPGCCPVQCPGCIPLTAGSPVLTAGISRGVSETSTSSARVKSKSFPGRTFHVACGRLDPQQMLRSPARWFFPWQKGISVEQFCVKGRRNSGKKSLSNFLRASEKV